MKKGKKYEFTGETKYFQGHLLRRIRYTQKFSAVSLGELGGWIEHEDNLSHEGNCFVKQEAMVFGNAKVIQNAWIFANSIVKDNAIIKNDAVLDEEVVVGADTVVAGHAWIGGDSTVYFYQNVEDDNMENIFGKTEISSCNIEATGTIIDCDIISTKLYGHLNLKDLQDF